MKKRPGIITLFALLLILQSTLISCSNEKTQTKENSNATEFTVYSLDENLHLEYVIDMYQAKNSNVKINYEIGFLDQQL